MSYRISFKSYNKEDAADATPDNGKASKKPAKIKKEKKPKATRKAEKSKKKAAAAASGKTKADGGKKKFPLIPVIIGAGALAVAAVVFLVVRINTPSVDSQLAKAAQLVTEAKYDDAAKIYSKLIKKVETMPEPYIGLADVYVAQNDKPSALETLDDALLPTGDNPLIVAKLNELNPPVEPETTGNGGAPQNEPIVFQDKAMERMIRQALGKSEADPILPGDLNKISMLKILGETHAAIDESIGAFIYPDGYEIDSQMHTERGSIATLNDLAHFKGLHKLVIGYNSVTDISALSQLTSLETLGLYANDISDISALQGLDGLKYLYIYVNDISDISPLSGLSSLEQLWINHNKISDLSALKSLSSLKELFISNNEISDISPVTNLKNLRILYADNNQIGDISPLAELELLSNVSFTGNPVADYTPISHVRNVNRPFLSND